MADDYLNWINDKKTFAAKVEYHDATPTTDFVNTFEVADPRHLLCASKSHYW
ncbi:hypothetical protein [Loigolactobacillus binensis]|uniref:Uncharacterized protein n=1 Tax=Loigolactobacillus binensis TaxID=2559922 RepID=A0ABW3EC78_9LACO|nr:hypothetical protein [Loigolactobacillus binensis]